MQVNGAIWISTLFTLYGVRIDYNVETKRNGTLKMKISRNDRIKQRTMKSACVNDRNKNDNEIDCCAPVNISHRQIDWRTTLHRQQTGFCPTLHKITICIAKIGFIHSKCQNLSSVRSLEIAWGNLDCLCYQTRDSKFVLADCAIYVELKRTAFYQRYFHISTYTRDTAVWARGVEPQKSF